MSKRSVAYAINFLVYAIVFAALSLSLKYWFTEPNTGRLLVFNLLCANLLGSLIILTSCICFNTFNLNDPYWSLQSIFNSFVYWNNSSNPYGLRSLLVFSLVNLWAVRLVTHLFVSNIHDIKHEDWRYVSFRQKLPHVIVYFIVGYISFMLVPTILVYFGCVPMFYVFNSAQHFNFVDVLALAMTATAIFFESVGDYQLRQALLTSQDKKEGLQCMDRGLWSLCRHPNYFGEITFWFGLSVFAVAADFGVVGDRIFGVSFLLGACAIFSMIYFGSMPLMEERQLKRRAKSYKAYVDRVPYKILPLNF